MLLLPKDEDQFLTGVIAGLLLHSKWTHAPKDVTKTLLEHLLAVRFNLKTGDGAPIKEAVEWAEESDKLIRQNINSWKEGTA